MKCDSCGARFKLMKKSPATTARDETIYKMRKQGLAIGELARTHGVTNKTILRVVARMRSREIQMNKKEGNIVK